MIKESLQMKCMKLTKRTFHKSIKWLLVEDPLCVNIYIFIVSFLDEVVILFACHFSMKNIMTSCDRGGNIGGANINVIQ